MRFSERHGFKPVKTAIQVDTIDQDLRNALWNVLKITYWDTVVSSGDFMERGYYLSYHQNEKMEILCKILWVHYFKNTLDNLSDDWNGVYRSIQTHYFQCKWYEIYDFIEFIANNYSDGSKNEAFMEHCNYCLKKEISAYRFVGGKITRIVSDEEIGAIEEAIQLEHTPTRTHLRRALEMLSDRKNPDYRNSVKESISAIEAYVRYITKLEKGTLGDLLKEMEKAGKVHPALKASFSSLYGYTSDADGIRHGLINEETSDLEDAKFMLVACSAFINYVSGKLGK